MVVIHSDHHVTHALYSAVLSVRQWDGHASKADHSRVCECQSGKDNHWSKETTGSKKESIILITSVSIFVYLRPIQYTICYVCFHCPSFHVTQSILVSVILSDSRLKLSRVSSSSASFASVVSFVVSCSCHPHLKNGSMSGSINLNLSTIGWWSGSSSCQVNSEPHRLSQQAWGAQQQWSSLDHPLSRRYALCSADATQKHQEFQRVIEQVKMDSLLRRLIKSQMAESPQQWDDHSFYVRHFIGSFAEFQETSRHSSTSTKVSTGTTSSSAKPSSTHGAPMVGSSHQGFQKRCQIRLTERILKIVRSTHPHMES